MARATHARGGLRYSHSSPRLADIRLKYSAATVITSATLSRANNNSSTTFPKREMEPAHAH